MRPCSRPCSSLGSDAFALARPLLPPPPLLLEQLPAEPRDGRGERLVLVAFGGACQAEVRAEAPATAGSVSGRA